MNLEKRFIEIQAFLNDHQYLHEREVLERYPEAKSPYHTWAQEIAQMTKEQKLTHENNGSTKFIKNTAYIDFLNKIKELSTLDSESFQKNEIPQNLKRKVSLKKQHEIDIIKQQIELKDFNHYVDIGSGAGHLSSYLLLNNNKTSTCVDQSKDFQQIGIKKLSRENPQILERMSFKTLTFSQSSTVETKENSLLLGLHACGDLSVEIINHFISSNNSALLNYGCCYHKLTEKGLSLSKFAKENPLKLTNHSLTLAAKSYKSKDEKESTFRDRVKLFRYGLHIYQQENLKQEFQSIGNATKEDYSGEFSAYAKKYSGEILKDVSNSELDDYIKSNQAVNKIESLLNLGIIRSHLARLVEIYLILDRGLYLKEKNYKVKLAETFNKDLSPRNISLYAERN